MWQHILQLYHELIYAAISQHLRGLSKVSMRALEEFLKIYKPPVTQSTRKSATSTRLFHETTIFDNNIQTHTLLNTITEKAQDWGLSLIHSQFLLHGPVLSCSPLIKRTLTPWSYRQKNVPRNIIIIQLSLVGFIHLWVPCCLPQYILYYHPAGPDECYLINIWFPSMLSTRFCTL